MVLLNFKSKRGSTLSSTFEDKGRAKQTVSYLPPRGTGSQRLQNLGGDLRVQRERCKPPSFVNT